MELWRPATVVWFSVASSSLWIQFDLLCYLWHWSIVEIVAIGFTFEPEIKVGNKSYLNASVSKLIGCIAVLCTNQCGHWRVHLENTIFRDSSCKEIMAEGCGERRNKRNGVTLQTAPELEKEIRQSCQKWP